MYVPCGEVGMASSHESSINGSRERVGSYDIIPLPLGVQLALLWPRKCGCNFSYSLLLGVKHF